MKKSIKMTTDKDNKADIVFWKGKSFSERLEAIELLRSQYFSLSKNASPTFQRVCRIVSKAEKQRGK